MLLDSPLYDRAYDDLRVEDMLDVWVKLLTTGQGYIDIIENKNYAKELAGYTRSGNRHFDHSFTSCYFMSYVTLDFMQKIVADDTIPDISMHFVKRCIEHQKNPDSCASPAATIDAMLRGHNQEPGYGLYCLCSSVIHPRIDIMKPKFILDSWKYSERVKSSTKYFSGGLAHHAWINNCAHEKVKWGYLQSNHKLLRAYPGNQGKTPARKKYIFCLTRDRYVSKDLHIPDNKKFDIEGIKDTGNWFEFLFSRQRRECGLTELEQETCYLIALGYTDVQIAQAVYPDLKNVKGDTRESQERLAQGARRIYTIRSGAARKVDPSANEFGRERLCNFIRGHLHEVRSVIVPLYPFPEDLVLPE